MSNKQRDFKLETVLTVTTGMNLVDDFDEIFEFYKYVFMDPLINTMSIQILNKSMISHLLEIHPELANIKYAPEIDGDIDRWLAFQKDEFGDSISVCVIGHTLSHKEKVKSLEYGEGDNGKY